jgi:hypothetical protein
VPATECTPGDDLGVHDAPIESRGFDCVRDWLNDLTDTEKADLCKPECWPCDGSGRVFDDRLGFTVCPGCNGKGIEE